MYLRSCNNIHLKQFIAIIILSVFFLAQFGKVMNFCFCEVSTFQQTKTFNCDCEKQLVPEIHIDKNSSTKPAQAPASLPRFDELFAAHDFTKPLRHTLITTAHYKRPYQEALHNVFRSSIFHPPSLAI